LKPRKLVKQTAANTVPKVINFIWVGKPIPDKYEQNIKRWAELNPTYQFQLWVDSTLLKDHRATPAQESQRFTSHKNIKVIDLVKDPLYQKMNNRRYFEDELSGQAKNYAAASDILRVEILYQYGGIYFDTDTYPTADPLPVAGLLAEHGILIAPFSRSGGLAWSNAVMAAAKKQHAGLKIMSDLISKNYQALYEDPGKLKKHRPIFATDISQQQLQTIEADRDNSVLLTSGPEMVKQAFALDYFPKLSSSVKKDINAVTSGSKDRGTLSPLGPGAVEGWKYAGFVMDARYVDIRSEKSWGLDQARQNQTGK
jgi:hypothetical protein